LPRQASAAGAAGGPLRHCGIRRPGPTEENPVILWTCSTFCATHSSQGRTVRGGYRAAATPKETQIDTKDAASWRHTGRPWHGLRAAFGGDRMDGLGFAKRLGALAAVVVLSLPAHQAAADLPLEQSLALAFSAEREAMRGVSSSLVSRATTPFDNPADIL